MGKYLLIGDWFLGTIAKFFINFIDHVAYSLVMVGYNVFYAVAQLDLFGGSVAGETLYNEITKRFYMILSVLMVFVFAYQLIMLIVDPDGKSKGASSQLVKDTAFSIILLIVLPLVYRYMGMFQTHVLQNNTIGAIILGTSAGASDKNPGKNVAVMVLISFFHPEGTTYSTFFDEEGNLYQSDFDEDIKDTKAYKNCIQECKKSDDDTKDHTATCEKYVKDLRKWQKNGTLSSITWGNGDLKSYIGDTMHYSWILSTAAALAVAYVFFLYAIDIGARQVKLGVLQLISPIPVVFRIFPQTKKTFDHWFDEMKKTYLELFIRVAIIFFALELVKLVPIFIQIIFGANSPVDADSFTKCVATLILVWGILKFAQDAPQLFKDLFAIDGNLFKGLNLNPLKPQDRITGNKAVMWGAGKVAGAIGGAQAGYKRRMNSIDSNNAANKGVGGARIRAIGSAVRGIGSGLKNGKALEGLSSDDVHKAMYAGSDKVNERLNSKFAKAKRDAYATYVKELNDPSISDAEAKEKYKAAIKAAKAQRDQDKVNEREKYRSNHANRIARDDDTINTEVKNANIVVEGATKIEGIAVDKAAQEQISELRKAKAKALAEAPDGADLSTIGGKYDKQIAAIEAEVLKKRMDAINSTAAYQNYFKDIAEKTEKAFNKLPAHDIESKDFTEALDEFYEEHKVALAAKSIDKTDTDALIKELFSTAKNLSKDAPLDASTLKALTELGNAHENYAAGAQAWASVEQERIDKTNGPASSNTNNGGSDSGKK